MTRRIGTASRYWSDEGKLVNLSGNAYVPARIRGANEPWTALRVREPSRCIESTVCVYCVEDWLWDWEIDLTRTGAGRRLAARCDTEGIDLTSYARWNANAPTEADVARARRNRGRCASH